MAMTDYFYNCIKLEAKTISDGLGGYDVVEYEGITFDGLAVKGGSQEQLIGALRGLQADSYTFHTYANIPLKKDDKVAYFENGAKKYIRLTTDKIVNAEQSLQTDWVSYNAESYVPTKVVQG